DAPLRGQGIGDDTATMTPPVVMAATTTEDDQHLVTATFDADDLAAAVGAPVGGDGRTAGEEIDVEALARAHARLALLYEIGSLLTATLDLGPLLRQAAARVREVLDADRCLVLLGSGERPEELEPAASASVDEMGGPVQVPRTVLGQVVTHRKSIHCADASMDVRLRDSESIRLGGVRSLAAAPLIRADKLLGALYVDSTRADRVFDDDDLRTLTAVAAQAAIAIENARLFAAAKAEVREFRQRAGGAGQIVGRSKELLGLLQSVRKVAATGATVLLTGETGSGKELFARAIHDLSPRADRPFIAVNCAAMAETLLESELFGHERGAFTGAHKTKPGKFELADGGTLFLDEVGEMSSSTQTKLLRVLEERRFERVGGVRRISVDVRIVAATNRDLPEEVRSGRFREDLYYRLAVVPLHVPPLRDRREDIPDLARHFLKRFARDLGKAMEEISADAMAALQQHDWPGNVRELQNAIERAVVLSERNRIESIDLPARVVQGSGASGHVVALPGDDLTLPTAIAQTERVYIARALEVARGKKVEAARLLGISRPTLDKKLKLHGLDPKKKSE
ncbi:MAG: sigma-54-dependent Fis family transcriptional regulator, partial [Planctomycetota bacterium]